MPSWPQSQREALLVEINKYALDQCYIGTGEVVPFEIASELENGDQTVEFTGDRTVSVLITGERQLNAV